MYKRQMLAREYLDQKQSAEAFEEVAELIKEDVELPALERCVRGRFQFPQLQFYG